MIAKIIASVFLGLSVLLGSVFHVQIVENAAKAAQALGGGSGTIDTLDQWKSDGTNITQRTASKPIKITGVTTGDCLTLDGSSILTTTTCGSGSGGGLATSSPWTAWQLAVVKSNSTLTSVATSSLGVTSPVTFSGTLGAQVGGVGGSFGCATCVVNTRALTVAGTSKQITSSAGSQDLSADRTWTLSLPSYVLFPGDYAAVNATTTNATTTSLYITGIARAAGYFLATDANGQVIGTTTPVGSGGVTSIGPTGQTLTGAVAIATSTSVTNGETSAITVVCSGATCTLTPSQSGTRTVAGGGTGVNTFTSGQLLYGNGTANLSSVATTSPTFGTGLTGGGTWTVLGSAPTLSIATSSLYTGTTGQFPYFSGTNTITATSSLFMAANGNVGVGTTSPYSKLSIGGNVVVGAPTAGGTLGDLYVPNLATTTNRQLSTITYFPWVDATGKFSVDSNTPYFDSANQMIVVNPQDHQTPLGVTAFEVFHDMDVTELQGANDIGHPMSTLSSYRGTYASPTTNNIGDILGEYRGYGVTTGPVFNTFTSIQSSIGGTTSGNAGGVLTFMTKADGGATTTAAVIDQNQNVGIASTTPYAKLSVGSGTASSTIAVAEYAYGVSGNVATSTATTIDARASTQVQFPMGTSATTLTVCNMEPGQTLRVRVVNPNASAGALTWAVCSGSQLYWPSGVTPTQTTTANHWDIWSFAASKSVASTTNGTIIISGAQTPF